MANSVLKHTWTTTVKNDSGTSVLADPPLVILGDAETNFAVQVLAGETAEVDAPVVVAKIQSGFVSSDQAVTIHTNAVDAAGGQTIELAAKKALSWNNVTPGMGANPFAPNVTKWFITNAGTSIANVRGGFLLQE